MLDNCKQYPVENISTVNKSPAHPPIKKRRVKRKELMMQARVIMSIIGGIRQVQTMGDNVIFLNSDNKSTGNLEWRVWPMRRERNPRGLFCNFSAASQNSNEVEDGVFSAPFPRLPLTKAKSVAQFGIDLSVCTRITDKTICLIFSRVKHIQSLEYLQICLEQNDKMTNYGIQRIASFLKNFKSLKEFYFGRSEARSMAPGHSGTVTLLGTNITKQRYAGFNLNNESLLRLCPSIRTMRSLTNLTFNLLDTDITDAGLIAISKSLASLDHLEYLKLILCATGIGDSGLIHLAETLPKLSSLTGIVLDFGMCFTIRESGITTLFSSMEKMKLSNLFLSFYRCAGFNGKVREAIPSALVNMKALTYLVLDLGGCLGRDTNLPGLDKAIQHISYKRIRTGFA